MITLQVNSIVEVLPNILWDKRIMNLNKKIIKISLKILRILLRKRGIILIMDTHCLKGLIRIKKRK